MVVCVKTTIDISRSLFEETKAFAGRSGKTFKEMVETALHLLLKSQKETQEVFKLRKHTFRGQGLAEDLADGDWHKIRARVYEGRGG